MRYLTVKDLSKKIGGRGRTSIYRDVAAGRLPKPVKFGSRIYWIEEEVDKYLREAAHV